MERQYPKKKQWALERLETRHDWVLFIDADERPSGELVSEIRRLTASGETEAYGAFEVDLDYWFNGHLLTRGHRVRKRALLNKTACRYPELDDLGAPGMGEQEGHYQPLSEAPVGQLSGRLFHIDRGPVGSGFCSPDPGTRLGGLSPLQA